MMLRTTLRLLFVGMFAVFFAVTWSPAQQGQNVPKAPEPVKAVPVQVLKDTTRSTLVLSADGKTIHTTGEGVSAA